ncbi:site-specific integrase [Bacteroides sedimenti]|uniref:Tyrosine recombinase n=1 Tax=Bacteroides sedimenti TaxID=2136147 RepID=A0ABM8IIA5_9BACE
MSVTVNVLCYKSKTLSNGENPLMIRVCKDGTKKYKSLGISINPVYWDFEKSKPKNNCPNKELINKIIANKSKEFSEQIVKLKSEDKDFTSSKLVEDVQGKVKSRTVNSLFLEQIQRLREEGRLGYMLSTQQVYNSLIRFNKHLNIYFSDIDVIWLKRYETWLRSEQLAENTIGIRFRTLRTIYNLAIEVNIVKAEYYPFKSFKVSKLHQATAKRAINKDEIFKVINYNVASCCFYKRMAVDLFTFSYLMGGINFVDIAFLTKDNLNDSRLVYVRRKTKKLIKLPLQEKAIHIIQNYHSENRKYLFPILFDSHKTDMQKRYRVHDVIADINRHLKDIGKELGIPIDLTTYVARHSFATVLKRSGVSTSIISESLGHSSEKVTQIYLDSFDNSQMKDAMRNLL